MTPDPAVLMAPATAAFPKYAGVLNAMAMLMAADASVPPPRPSPTPGPTPPNPAPSPAPTPMPAPRQNPPAVTLIAGRALALSGDGTVCAFDFGDAVGQFNALRGYNAAHVYDMPGAFTAVVSAVGKPFTITRVTVVNDARPVVTLAALDDLASAVGRISTATILQLAPGAAYDLKSPLALAVDGVTLRAAPAVAAAGQPASAAPVIRRLAAPGAYSTLIIGAADISIEGITFDSDQPLKAAGPNIKVGVYALNVMGVNLLVRSCTFRNVDDAFHCQAKARGLVAVDCTFTDELRSCAAYLDAMRDVVLLRLTAVGSVCEHIVRLEGSQNVLVHGCDLDNKDGKETVAIRIGSSAAIMSNTLRAWARISEGMQAPTAVYCHDILFSGNHFAGLRPIGPWLQINPNCKSVAIEGNAFDVDETQVAVAVQAPVTDLRLTNNQLTLTAGAKTCRPLVDPFGNPALSETGTITRAA